MQSYSRGPEDCKQKLTNTGRVFALYIFRTRSEVVETKVAIIPDFRPYFLVKITRLCSQKRTECHCILRTEGTRKVLQEWTKYCVRRALVGCVLFISLLLRWPGKVYWGYTLSSPVFGIKIRYSETLCTIDCIYEQNCSRDAILLQKMDARWWPSIYSWLFPRQIGWGISHFLSSSKAL